MRYGHMFAFFGELILWGDFPIQSSTRQIEVMSGSTGSCHMPQYYAIASMHNLLICPGSIMGGIYANSMILFMRDEGCSKFFITSSVAIYFDEVIIM